MPPKFLFTKDEIISAAVEVVRSDGAEALTARSLAAKLGCSVKPIFGAFKNMEEVRSEVINAAGRIYRARLAKAAEEKLYPPYKASGMEYIKFAKEDTELFKLLFMRSRSPAEDTGAEEMPAIIAMIRKATGFDEETAFLFHLDMWVFVHGIATMIATDYLEWDDDFVSRALTDCYFGLKSRFSEKLRTKEE